MWVTFCYLYQTSYHKKEQIQKKHVCQKFKLSGILHSKHIQTRPIRNKKTVCGVPCWPLRKRLFMQLFYFIMDNRLLYSIEYILIRAFQPPTPHTCKSTSFLYSIIPLVIWDSNTLPVDIYYLELFWLSWVLFYFSLFICFVLLYFHMKFNVAFQFLWKILLEL